MEWRAGVACMLNHLKLWKNGGWHLSWRWWPCTISCKNLLEVMLLHWSKNSGLGIPNCTEEDDENCNSSGMTPPTACHLPKVIVTGQCIRINFLLPWWPSDLGSRWGSFGKEALPDSHKDCFWTLNQNPVLDLSLAPFIKVEDWNIPRED